MWALSVVSTDPCTAMLYKTQLLEAHLSAVTCTCASGLVEVITAPVRKLLSLPLINPHPLLTSTAHICCAQPETLMSDSEEDSLSDGCPSRASELMDRIRKSLYALRNVYNAQMVEDAIILAREALVLSPAKHTEDRLEACMLLAESLRYRFSHDANDSMLEEIIKLGREALDLSPERHPLRARSCGNLAVSLTTRYERTGSVVLLDEAVDLQREALALRPEGYPDHFTYCGNLASLLQKCYRRTGDLKLLDEAIYLQREVLIFSVAGDTYRSWACENLAISLQTYYEHTGDVEHLDEAIGLERKALDLRPAGHPNRSLSCSNLATALEARWERTSDNGLLDEVIDLQRESLNLHPAGHPDHCLSCGNLAVSLINHYKHSGDVGLVDEATDLLRETLALRPVGRPDRTGTCVNLAISLMIRYEHTNDVGLLNEAIDLQREVINLRPADHPKRHVSCGNLARSLSIRYKCTGDVALLYESLALSEECVSIAPVHTIWKSLHDLAETRLQDTNPSFDVSKAILYLSQSLEHDPDDTPRFVTSLSNLLNNLWACNLEGRRIQLTVVYQRLVKILPLLVHPALDLQPQLRALKACTRLGPDAFVNAAFAGNYSVGLETLELAQGVVWSTTLHRRDPQLKYVPEHLASKLQGLLQSIARISAAQLDDEYWGSLTSRDMLHTRSSQAYAAIREIRALSGLERFMLGESFEDLRTVASNHPVVVLVGARGHHYALILMAPSVAENALLPLDLTAGDEMALSSTKSSMRQSRGGIADEPSVERALKISAPSRASALERQFKILWDKVVKPVFEHLDLKVSE
jgi:tetratricopeptide (TPR) repeat protein